MKKFQRRCPPVWSGRIIGRFTTERWNMKGFRRSAVACAFIATAGLPTAAAAQGMTARLGTPTLIARVSVQVPVIVSCPPFDPSLTHYSGDIQVTVDQASGRQVAHGTGSLNGFLPNVLFPCDGAEYTLSVPVLASESGPPFHGGPAVFSVRAGAQAGLPCYPGSTNCFFGTSGQFAIVEPTAVNMH
jgi:hypothetical protein